MKPARILIAQFLLSLLALSPTTSAGAARMIGYWEGWGSIRLSNVSTNYDVVMLSFGTGSGTDAATMDFVQSVESTANLKADVTTLHSRGVKVLLSVGGGGGPHTVLANATDTNNFVTSVEGIVDTYGIDGVDLDFEDGIFAADEGDNDIFHPTTPTIVNLITAMHQLRTHYGANFMVTAPPESEAMNGYGYFGNQVGSGWTSAYAGFIAFMNGTRDILTFAAPQYYNAANYYGVDNNSYAPGSPDFDVSQMELILAGHTLITGQYCPPLAPSQLAIGVPAQDWGDGSYLTPANVLKAAQYLGSGTSYGGNYHLANINGYPGFGGVMTWDINLDQAAGYALANTLAPYLHSLPSTASTVTDYFDNLSVASSHSANWQVAANVGANVGNDPNVLVRTVDDAEFLTYQRNGITGFNLRAYTDSAISNLSILTSPNGSTWTPLNLITGSKSTSAGSWGWYNIIPAVAVPAGTNYLEILVTGSTGTLADPTLSQLSITYTGAAPSVPAPPTPASVTAAARDHGITLLWRGSTGATAYNVYRSTGSGSESAIATGVASTSYVDFGLTAGAKYYYKVAAVNTGGTSTLSTEVSATYVTETGYVAANAPGVVQADNYDNGGSGIGYWAGGLTTSPTAGGWVYRNDGVGVETCTDTDGVGNGYDVGYTSPGYWLNYTVTAEAVGTYNVAIRVASNSGGKFHIGAVNGLSLSPQVTVPNTGGWQTWTTVNTTVNLMAGTQIIRLYEDTGGTNIEYMRFVDQTPSKPSNLTASAGPGHGAVNLFWLPSTNGAASYRVYRGTTDSGENYTSPMGTNIHLKIANNGCVFTDTTAAPGATYYYTVKAVNTTGTSAASNEASVTIAAPGPYSGTPYPVPGVVDFDNYDTGGQGSGYYVNNQTSNQGGQYRSDYVGIETCTDSNGVGNGFNVGWTNGGNWLDYTVNVASPGTYTVTFRIAAPLTGAQFHLENATGTNLTGAVAVPATGDWQTWGSVTATVNLPAGRQDLYLVEDTSGVNLEYMSFVTTLTPPPAPTGLTATAANA